MDKSEFRQLKEEGQLITSVQLADELGVQTVTIRRWCKDLNIQPVFQARENYFNIEQSELLREYGNASTSVRRQIERRIWGSVYEARLKNRAKKRSLNGAGSARFNRILLIGLAYFIVVLIISIVQRFAERSEAMKVRERAIEWPVVFSEGFDTNENGWLIGVEEFDPGVERLIKDGRYRWKINSNESSVSLVLMNDETFKDFYLSMQAGVMNTWENWDCEFGAIMRLTEDGEHYGITHKEYVESHGEHHYYGYLRFDVIHKEEMEVLFYGSTRARDDWFPGPPSIRHPPDGLAHIEIVAEGAKFYIFIDGIFGTVIEDDRLREGGLGLIVTWPGEVSDFIVDFDNIEIRAP